MHNVERSVWLYFQIAYHEKLTAPVEYTGTLENKIGKTQNSVTMTVLLKPDPDQVVFKHATFRGEEVDDRFTNPISWYAKAVNSGIKTALRYGELYASVMHLSKLLRSGLPYATLIKPL